MYASLYSIRRCAPQTRNIWDVEDSISRAVIVSAAGQEATGPSADRGPLAASSWPTSLAANIGPRSFTAFSKSDRLSFKPQS
jgi:hypothetical protein